MVSESSKNDPPLRVTREIDRTVCARCKTDYGLSQLPLVGNVPICGNCSSQIVNRPFPQWLKLSLAGLLALLVVALVHGRVYFAAGRSLARGEKAIKRHDYRAASDELQKVLKVAPRSQKAILLAAKAAMMSCDMETAEKTLNLRPTYEQNALFREVNGQWGRAIKAYDDAVKASKLSEDGKHDAEAAQLMQQASGEFPECKQLRIAAEAYTGGAAFSRKDYDGFLAHSSAALQMDPNSPDLLGTEASAFAAKYAATGLPEYQARAEEDLKKAEQLSENDPKAKASYTEYAERIRYRLESREIIDRDEYNRRFRNGKDPLKGAS